MKAKIKNGNLKIREPTQQDLKSDPKRIHTFESNKTFTSMRQLGLTEFKFNSWTFPGHDNLKQRNEPFKKAQKLYQLIY